MAMNFASFLLHLLISTFILNLVRAEENTETYIIHIDPQINDLDSFLTSSLIDDQKKPRVVHQYRHVLAGFAAKLSADEVKAMEGRAGFVSARRERVYSLDTTRSPAFLGLSPNEGLWKASNFGKGIIIGMLDSGITPGHPSFDDAGVPPPPSKWKGTCAFGFCNNKLIGARNFVGGGDAAAPVDNIGHGTHTAGTAGGNFVPGANIQGSANGTASGVAPLAHLAVYKVCGTKDCAESDILAGLDAAIGDGVDVISLSLSSSPRPFHRDNVMVGAFRAMEKGIFVSTSAGNTGPGHGSVKNDAPWLLTVGASTVDRRLAATVVLGDGQRLEGQSVFQPQNFTSSYLEVIYPGASKPSAVNCAPRSLNQTNVTGKIVLCELGGSPGRISESLKNAGAAALIILNPRSLAYTFFLAADPFNFPTSRLGSPEAANIILYASKASNPTAKILFEGTQIGDPHAPFMASFSSRGPSMVTPGILKPDITGPGSNILAAWPKPIVPNSPKFNMISGTSMSCPHLSGVAALLKSTHPDWSPAAIKSAIMTSADTLNRGGKPIEDETHLPADVFATGAGHVNPARANDPGLVYDLQPDDYIPYLCGLKYTNSQVSLIVQRTVDCSKLTPIPEAQLNYPSFSFNPATNRTQTYTRTVTNVGEANSSYRVEIVPPKSATVDVSPTQLVFTKVGEKLSYNVTFTKSRNPSGLNYYQGVIRWISATHTVSSPIAVTINKYM